LVGAEPSEVVAMSSLTANLHAMLASFYRPQGERVKIVIEAGAFPSDTYAVTSHVALRGQDPAHAVVTIAPREGELALRLEDLESLLRRESGRVALVLLAGVNFFTGQALDVEAVSRSSRKHGALCGFDLAHMVGNLPLRLHAWDVDFAVWCSYKYLNAGPGAVAGCFVHARHGDDPTTPRLAGWWGNDPTTRFTMPREFVPKLGADGWQLSNPPILSLAPLRASLDIFDAVGMTKLREKSLLLTTYLEALIDSLKNPRFTILTPRDPRSRGCQLSLRVSGDARAVFDAIAEHDVVCDFRHPDVIRMAPVPLYNSFHDVWRLVHALSEVP
jgi:kynureninase